MEQAYLQYVSRANTVPYSGTSFDDTDGFQETNGNVVIYWVSGTTKVGAINANNPVPPTTTNQELEQDIVLIKKGLNEFYDVVKSGNTFTYNTSGFTGYLVNGVGPAPTAQSITEEVFIPFSTKYEFGFKSFRRQYMILSNELKGESYQSFKNAIIGNLIGNNTLATGGSSMRYSEEFDAYWLNVAKPAFDEENNITSAFLDEMEKNKLKNFITYTPFPLGKPREFDYAKSTSPEDNQVKLIKSLGDKTNQNNDPVSWNTQITGTVYISKVKLN